MLNLLFFLFAVVLIFFLGSIAGVIGKRYGVEYLISLVSALVVMANILANKIIQLGKFNVPAGIIAFSFTFFITDVISEKWGKSYAKKAVWAGFFSSLFLLILLYIVLNLESPVFFLDNSRMFSKVLSLTPRITIAGFIAYLISQHHDVWAFDFWKKRTKGKYLWVRNNASTIVSQFLDSVIFVSIAFYGVYPVIPMIIGQFIIKTGIALIDTPFIYLSSFLIEHIKPKTCFKTNKNPF